MSNNDLMELGSKSESMSVTTAKESDRAKQEIQAAYVIAKKFPRDIHKAYTNIMESCKRKRLAEKSVYAYPRSGQMVTGASIRLAEVMAQNWGNLNFGIVELESGNGESVVESYCVDLETNVYQRKIFTVKHEIYTKKGTKKLTDPRDIYELIANMGARRLRACILGIIPKDIEEDAVNACKKTMATNDEPIIDRIKKMLMAFNEVGINPQMIEKRVGHKIDALIEEELVSLRTIYMSIKDGFSKREDWFEFERSEDNLDAQELNKLIKE